MFILFMQYFTETESLSETAFKVIGMFDVCAILSICLPYFMAIPKVPIRAKSHFVQTRRKCV